MLQAALHLLGHIGARFVIDKGHDLRLERIGARHQLAHGIRAPHQATLFGEINFGVGRVIEAICAQMEMRRQRLQAGLSQRFGLLPGGLFILPEAEAF